MQRRKIRCMAIVMLLVTFVMIFLPVTNLHARHTVEGNTSSGDTNTTSPSTPTPTPTPTLAPTPTPTLAPTPQPGPTPPASSDGGGLFDFDLPIFGDILSAIESMSAAEILISPEQAITKALGRYIAESLNRGMLAAIMNNMINFKDQLAQTTPAQSDVVKSINRIMIPFATTLLSLFFVIELFKKTAFFEMLSLESFAQAIIQVIIAKYFVQNSLTLLETISGFIDSITRKIINLSAFQTTNLITNDTRTAFEQTESEFFTTFMLTLLLIATVFLYIAMTLRQIELGLLCCTAPLFLCTFVSETTMDVFVTFIKTYVAVCAQTIFMAIACAMYMDAATGRNNMFVGTLETSIGILGLAWYIIQTPNSIRSLIGAGSRGGSMAMGAVRSAVSLGTKMF